MPTAETTWGQLGLVEQDYAWISAGSGRGARQRTGNHRVSCLPGGYNLSARSGAASKPICVCWPMSERG